MPNTTDNTNHTLANKNVFKYIIFIFFAAIPGDQSLGTILMTVEGKRRNILNGEPLPLSPKSTLAWMGLVSY